MGGSEGLTINPDYQILGLHVAHQVSNIFQVRFWWGGTLTFADGPMCHALEIPNHPDDRGPHDEKETG
jgi:hypothetical protein